ncbi:MAG: glycosyltransferase family 1 protein [Clostridia bacterium]|nr:glycosyltransferase family 1 protein [Clostridia bacterium]
MKRVLHIVSVMNYAGIETFLMNCYRNIARDKLQFDFLVTRQMTGKYDEEINALGGRIYNLPAIKKVGYFRFKRAADEFFRTHEYDVVHCHMNTWSGFFLPIAEKYGVKTRIAHSHMANQPYSLFEGLFKNHFKKKIIPHATKLLACSKDAGKWLFGNDADFEVINDAIEIEAFAYNKNSGDKKREKYGLRDNFVIGHTGRFVLQKNHVFLLEVFKEYLKINENARLLLVGGCIEKRGIKYVNDLVDSYGLRDKVVIAGENPDMPEHFSAMDVFVFPSHFEGLGMALIEAQANGLTCFVSDKVPSEAFATPLAVPLSLEKSAKEWAERIEEIRKKKEAPYRDGPYSGMLREKGFDIRDTVEKLYEYWL